MNEMVWDKYICKVKYVYNEVLGLGNFVSFEYGNENYFFVSVNLLYMCKCVCYNCVW